MPSEEGLGPDKEAASASLAQEPAQPRQDGPVRWAQGGSSDLTAQYGDLMAEHDNLDGQVLLRAARQSEQLEETNEGNVEEREGHTPYS